MPLTIALLVPGMPFDGASLTQRSLGGSETAALSMALELGRRGHEVVVCCNTPAPSQVGTVRFLPAQLFGEVQASIPHDVCIVQRTPQPFAMRSAAKLNVLWCHDLAHARTAQQFLGCMWNIDRVAVVSRWMAGQYREVLGLTDDQLWVTRNGVDLSLFPAEAQPRDRKRLLYTSRPERGLDVLLSRILPRVIEAEPDVALDLACYDNQVEQLAFFYDQINALAAGFGERIRFLGHLAKPALYEVMARAGCLAYPNPSPIAPDFVEVSCITAMEAMAAGLPFVGSARGALPETLAEGAGVLIPEGPEHDDAMVAAIIRVIRNEDGCADAMGEAGREAAKALGWDALAAEWEAEFLRSIEANNDDMVRLAHHFYRRQDIEGAKAALAAADGDPRAKPLRKQIAKQYAFTKDPETLSRYYQTVVGPSNEAVPRGLMDQPARFRDQPVQRFAQIGDILARYGAPTSILDFGAGHGECATYLHNRFGGVRYHGVDASGSEVNWARKLADRHAVNPTAMTFERADERTAIAGEYDALVIAEVLEHVHDPVRLLERLESRVRRGGTVVITVPFGPWETQEPKYRDAPQHIREFDAHGLRELFGGKAQMEINACFQAMCPMSGEPLGYWLVSYRADQKPLGRIDMRRKLGLQRPRQTVSVCMMCGGPAVEETLHWCLRSVLPIADEIVIADAGMSAEARRIAEQYGARLVPSPSPLEAGFETPRNIALAECTMDWVLWIDADEKLLGAARLNQYLRSNGFAAYGVRQHHLAVDYPWKPDIPTRLFRRQGWGGKAFRFFGMVHEHPELGLNEGPGPHVCLSDVHIAHIGYLIEEIRRGRFERNLPLLARDIDTYPERRLQKHLICRDNILLARRMLEQTGGRATPAVTKLCQETIAIYREHFLGKGQQMGNDTLDYYSEAVRMLGTGMQVELKVAAQRDGVGEPVNGASIWFASQEDALAEIAGRAKMATDPLAKPWW